MNNKELTKMINDEIAEERGKEVLQELKEQEDQYDK